MALCLVKFIVIILNIKKAVAISGNGFFLTLNHVSNHKLPHDIEYILPNEGISGD